MDDKTLRSKLIRLAHENPQHRAVLLPLLMGDAPNSARHAVFSEPNPRNMMTQYLRMQSEFEEFLKWSDTLQTSLKAIGKELPVSQPLQNLRQSQAALGASLEALAPLVHVYLGRRTSPG